MVKYNLGFGNSPAVREAFVDTYGSTQISFGPQAFDHFDYPRHEGDL